MADDSVSPLRKKAMILTEQIKARSREEVGPLSEEDLEEPKIEEDKIPKLGQFPAPTSAPAPTPASQPPAPVPSSAPISAAEDMTRAVPPAGTRKEEPEGLDVPKKEKEEKTEKATRPVLLRRNTLITYYHRMNPQTNYILKVQITKAKLKFQREVGIHHVRGKIKVEKEEEEPTIIRVIPFFPGCLVTPEYIDVNIDVEEQEAIFYITPLGTLGKINSAVEFWYKGQRIGRSRTPSEVKDQAITKAATAIGIGAAVVPPILEIMGINIFDTLNLIWHNLVPGLAPFTGYLVTWAIIIVILLVSLSLAGFFYARRRPQVKELAESI
ncbi:MAG: hypothetical protein ACXQS8_08210, partial [Candidatus Helarchaeales archaeon]